MTLDICALTIDICALTIDICALTKRSTKCHALILRYLWDAKCLTRHKNITSNDIIAEDGR